MTYQARRTQLLAGAYICGPLVMLASVSAFLFGGRMPEPADYGSGVEGLIGVIGFALLVPVFMHLADGLGESMPRLATASLIVALLGFAGGGVYQMSSRVTLDLALKYGFDPDMLQRAIDDAEAGSVTTFLVIFIGPLVPISSLLVGIGYIRSRLDRRVGWLLTASGALTLTGQLLVIATEVTYTAALVLWAVALVPVGRRMWSQPETTPATSPRRQPVRS